MSFTDSIKTCFEKIFTIDGRASRSEFWYFILFEIIVTAIVGFIFKDASFIVWAVSAVLTIARLTVSVRRLHDIGKSGWWMLLTLVPVIGWIVIMIFHLQDSEPGHNQYGSNPKRVFA